MTIYVCINFLIKVNQLIIVPEIGTQIWRNQRSETSSVQTKRNRISYPKKVRLEFSGAFFLAEIFEKVSFDPYNFRIARLSARKSEQIKNF